MAHLSDRIRALFSPNRQLLIQLEHLIGFVPKRIVFYQMALMHKSQPEGENESNERLEFLGDAILGAIIAEYLFKKYPNKPEGFLTELRSKIVRRETMNNVAMQMGLNKLMHYNQQDKGLRSSHIFGNALEALIGAIYLDRGFINTRDFILNHFIRSYIDLDKMESTDSNYKNQFLSWAQRNNYTVSFETLSENNEGQRKLFTVGIMLNGELFASGTGYNKKEAGQSASQKGIEKMNQM